MKALGYDSLDTAAARMRVLGGTYVTMSVAGGSDLEPGTSWSGASSHSTVSMNERDFALFALFASIGFETLAHPMMKIVPKQKLLPSMAGHRARIIESVVEVVDEKK